MKKLSAIALSLIMLLSLAACGGGTTGGSGSTPAGGGDSGTPAPSDSTPAPSGGGEELHFMFFEDGTDIPKAKAREDYTNWFNENNEFGVTVVLDRIQSEQAKVKLPTLMAAGNEPDMFHAWGGDFLRPYYEAGKLYNVTEVYESDPEWRNQFSVASFDALTFEDGNIYGFPGVIYADFAFYNKAIYDELGLELPDTQEELMAASQVIRDDGKVAPIAMGNKEAWPCASYSEMLVDRVGGSSVITDVITGKTDWTNPAFVGAVEKLKELSEYFPDGFNALSVQENLTDFMTGKAACVVNTSGFVSRMLSDECTITDDIVVKRHPLIPEGKGDDNALVGQAADNIIITSACKNKDAAVAYVKGFYTVENQQKMVEAGEIPAFRSELLDLSALPDLTKQVFAIIDEATSMQLYYDLVFGPVVGVEYNNVVQNILGGADATSEFERFQQFYEENYKAE